MVNGQCDNGCKTTEATYERIEPTEQMTERLKRFFEDRGVGGEIYSKYFYRAALDVALNGGPR